MSERMNNKNRSFIPRAIPALIAVLAIASGLLLPRIDSLYLVGHATALVLALAVPLAHGWLIRRSRSNSGGAGRFLSIGLLILGVVSALASGIMLSMGNPVNASGDIGGMFLWVVSTVALLGFSIAAFTSRASKVAM